MSKTIDRYAFSGVGGEHQGVGLGCVGVRILQPEGIYQTEVISPASELSVTVLAPSCTSSRGTSRVLVPSSCPQS